MQMLSWLKIKKMFFRSNVARLVRSRTAPLVRRGRAWENRLAIRKSQRFQQGFIWSDRMAFSKPCSIRDVSMTGTRVDLYNAAVKSHLLAGIVTLYFPADDREIDCRVMWRTGRSVGLQFVGSYRPATRLYGGR